MATRGTIGEARPATPPFSASERSHACAVARRRAPRLRTAALSAQRSARRRLPRAPARTLSRLADRGGPRSAVAGLRVRGLRLGSDVRGTETALWHLGLGAT